MAALDLASIGLNERDKFGVIEQIAEIIILECQLAIFGIQLDSLLQCFNGLIGISFYGINTGQGKVQVVGFGR